MEIPGIEATPRTVAVNLALAGMVIPGTVVTLPIAAVSLMPEGTATLVRGVEGVAVNWKRGVTVTPGIGAAHPIAASLKPDVTGILVNEVVQFVAK